MSIKMACTVFAVLSLILLNSGAAGKAVADERDEEIAELKTQVKGLMARIEKLEQEQAKSTEEAAKAKEESAKTKEASPRVDLEKIASKLKIKGRWAAGYFASGKNGSYPAGSFEIPEGKVLLTFEPDDINKIIMRMNLNNATFNNLDYFYVDTELNKFFNLGFPLSSRIGKMKVDLGEETWSNNPVESVLSSNSAANITSTDEGVQLSGKINIPQINPLGYSISVTNGNAATDTSTSKAVATKLYYNIIDPLYVSASYYNSGDLKASNAGISIAGLSTAPSGALKWSREIWEVDLRYDFKKGKVLNPPAYSDSKAILRLAYGGFSDNAKGGAKRPGDYGFVEGTYNLTKKFYLAGRYSLIDLYSDSLASLNNITANKYQRYSLGLGYRLTGATILKLGYDWNRESGQGIENADADLLSAMVASQF